MPKLIEQFRLTIVAKHYSRRTRKAYEGWIRRYIKFHGTRHPKDMGGEEVEEFLSYLASERKVAASTQNQAMSALLVNLGRAAEGLEHIKRRYGSTPKPIICGD